MFTANTVAKAKLVFNKKLDTYKLVVAFNVHKSEKLVGEVVKVTHNFPVQAKCAYVSGDLQQKTLQADLAHALRCAEATIRSANIVFVD